MQITIGTLMLVISFNAEEYMNNVSCPSRRTNIWPLTSHTYQPSEHIYSLSAAFTTLVILSATQGKFSSQLFMSRSTDVSWSRALDIAVDGA